MIKSLRFHKNVETWRTTKYYRAQKNKILARKWWPQKLFWTRTPEGREKWSNGSNFKGARNSICYVPDTSISMQVSTSQINYPEHSTSTLNLSQVNIYELLISLFPHISNAPARCYVFPWIGHSRIILELCNRFPSSERPAKIGKMDELTCAVSGISKSDVSSLLARKTILQWYT